MQYAYETVATSGEEEGAEAVLGGEEKDTEALLEVPSDDGAAKRRLSWVIILSTVVMTTGSGAAAAWMASSNKKHGSEQAAPDVTALIQDPITTAEVYGFAPAPMYFLNLKAFMNYTIQMLLLVGSRLCAGPDAIKNALASPSRFKITTIAFQMLGMASTAFAFVSLWVLVDPLASWAHWEIFAYLVTQVSATITLIVGLGNNATTAKSIKDKSDVAYSEKLVAQGFTVIGLILGTPVWIAMLTAGWYGILTFVMPALALGLVAFLLLLKVGDGRSLYTIVKEALSEIGKRDMSQVMFLAYLSVLTSVSMLVIWLLAGITNLDAWHLVGATVLELVLPMFGCFGLVMKAFPNPPDDQSALLSLGSGFVVAVCFTFFIVLVMPASLLAMDSNIGYGGAAPAAFMGKTGAAFANYTFVIPASEALQSVDPQGDHAFIQSAQMMVAHVVSFWA